MKMLQETAPDVYQGFLDGDFVTKETSQKFNQISDDQALEHVNRNGKVAGGLVGITRTDTACKRWCITYNERAQLTEFNIMSLVRKMMKSQDTKIWDQSGWKAIGNM
jgi:hypothetical protein